MELNARRDAAKRALTSLEQALVQMGDGLLQRDGAIQRFEYTLEAVWKLAQMVLRSEVGADATGAKPVIRASLQQGWISEEVAEALLEAVEDRNLTVHTYQEPLAVAIAGRLPAHAKALRGWFTGIP